MSFSTVVHEIEGKPDHLTNYLEDYAPEEYARELNKHQALLIDILEDFRRDKSFINIEPD